MSVCRIAVSGLVRPVDQLDRTGVNAGYVAAVLDAGGLPFICSPLLGPALAADALEPCHALLLTGGADLDPATYRALPSPALGDIEPARDAFEFALLEAARHRRLPILAICRGLQLVNVAAGGTLWQDLPTDQPGGVDHRPSSPSTVSTHSVRLAPASRIHALLGGGPLRTNSTHHQGIRELGHGLVATGWAEDGLIEALESGDSEEWLIAVQWHPERGAAGAPDEALFRGFVAAAEGKRYASSPSPR